MWWERELKSRKREKVERDYESGRFVCCVVCGERENWKVGRERVEQQIIFGEESPSTWLGGYKGHRTVKVVALKETVVALSFSFWNSNKTSTLSGYDDFWKS